jgi:large exoprotein involved in heme utilization and adhesion
MTGGMIAARTARTGPAGDIVVHVTQLTATAGAQITTQTFGVGAGGTITISADTVAITGQ